MGTNTLSCLTCPDEPIRALRLLVFQSQVAGIETRAPHRSCQVKASFLLLVVRRSRFWSRESNNFRSRNVTNPNTNARVYGDQALAPARSWRNGDGAI